MKTKYFRIVFLLMICFYVISCVTNHKGNEINSTKIELVKSAFVNQSLLTAVQRYINEFPQYKSYTLICSPKRYISIDSIDTDNDYLLGPSYEGLFKEGYCPVLYFNFRGKMIFVKTHLEDLLNTNHCLDSVYKANQVKRGIDSIVNELNWTLKNGDVLYYYKAIYFSVNRHKKVSIISDKPDTIFLPRLKKTIKFTIN